MIASGAYSQQDTPEKPALEDSLSYCDGDTEEDIEKKKREEAEKLKNSSFVSPASKPEEKGEDNCAVSHEYSPDPPIPHPRITPLGSPPPLDILAFPSWQHSMKSYLNSASIELWRILQAGFQAVNRSNLTRREVVQAQLNATAIHMIEQAVGKEKHQIEHCTTAKEAWKVLEDAYLGNESMRRNRIGRAHV